MATLAACASTNFTTATTWAAVDATSFSGSETAGTALTTSYVTSSTFTPGAITIDGIGVKLSNRTGTTGTITVALDQAGSDVANTIVTINCSDLPAATTALLDGGWIFFKFGTTVALAGATAYSVKAKTSSSSQVTLFSTATTNWSRYLRTTTTQAPVAGDDLIIAKEWTAAATGTARSVTMDQTAATDYGSAPTAALGLVTPGIAICQGGDLTYGTTAATNYLLQLSNSLIVYNGGTLNIGTTGTPIPRGGSAVLQFDLAADGDYGLVARNGSTVNLQGLSRTVGKNVVSAKMTADAAASGGAPSTSTLTIDTDTGWLSGDAVAVASTTRTASNCEVGTLNANAGASSIVVKDMTAGSAGMAYPPTSNRGLLVAHSGTSPTKAEVILLSRNVRIRSTSATLMSYVQIKAGAVVDIDWTEFYYIGTSTSGQNGVDVEVSSTAATNFSMQFSSIHDTEVGGFNINSGFTGTLTNLVFSSNTLWNVATVTGPACQINSAVLATNYTIDSNILLRTGSGNGWTLNDVGGTFTSNTVVGAASVGIALSEAAAIGTITGNTCHSNASTGAQISVATGLTGTFGSFVGWRNNGFGFQFNSPVFDFILDSPVLFGNSTDNINFNVNTGNVQIKTPVLSGDTSFATTNGIRIASTVAGPLALIDNGDFSTVTGIKTAHTNDINLSIQCGPQFVLRNTNLGAATEVATPSNLSNNGFISSEKHDQTAGNHITWMRNGKVQTDATTFNTAAPSMLMTPTSASLKLESAAQFQGIKVPVASGGAVTPTVFINKAAAYNGNQPRLIVRANPAIGIASDTVLATYSAGTGSWNSISGATAAVTDDGELEFIVDCDGTAGAINVDDWSFTGGVQDNGALKYWFNGLPAQGVVPTASSSGGISRARAASGF